MELFNSWHRTWLKISRFPLNGFGWDILFLITQIHDLLFKIRFTGKIKTKITEVVKAFLISLILEWFLQNKIVFNNGSPMPLTSTLETS